MRPNLTIESTSELDNGEQEEEFITVGKKRGGQRVSQAPPTVEDGEELPVVAGLTRQISNANLEIA